MHFWLWVERRIAPRVHIAPALVQQRETDVEIPLEGRELVPHSFGNMRGDALASGDGLRINLGSRMRKNAAWDVIEYTRLQNLNSGEHQRRFGIRVCHGRRRHSSKARNQTIVRLHDAEALIFWGFPLHKCCQCFPSSMYLQRSFDINVGAY